MDIKDFKSGIFRQQYEYKSFLPNSIHREWVVSDARLNNLLSEANLTLGRLDAFSRLIPDVDFFIRMHIVKEATQSSRIEGTQTTMEEAFLKEADVNPEKKNDWAEVNNYIFALKYAIGELKKLPLSTRLLRQTHEVLMQGVRGRHKMPGEFRSSQNWIGGTSLKDAIFIPPIHTEVPELMSDLEKFLNETRLQVPHLIKIGLAHYQFETIHPFLDGNGRLGRLLITLYLVRFGILNGPTLYLSDFFERNRSLYYDNLMQTRLQHNLPHWLTFFLTGVLQTATNSIETFEKILKLQEDIEGKRILKLGKKSEAAKTLVKHLYKNPLVTASDVEKILHVNISTANRMIDDFVKLKILKERTGFKRNRIFSFHEYLGLFYNPRK
ncbi:MAG TPA: Fic family protein [bacterium]|nr:Fic family protein [bacterium]HMW35236.1 Fic family protein [bacterium]HMZ03535.1 Fic family protein [bacterium]HNB08088.1 Fic family protein [bacterium]HND76503.1 Fic family protein [bacterium]